MIDCDADPIVMEEHAVYHHKKGGIITWSELDLSNEKLRLNANVLDHLLSYPFRIPERWKEKGVKIYFGDTLYGDALMTYVRYLYWGEDQWQSDFEWLDDGP